jgi:hypothetical protein
MPRICVLGWGSLVNHPEGDASIGQTALETVGQWHRDGPTLPLEFSRVSTGKRLTLVVDSEHGTENQVFTIQSAYSALDDAIENLRLREGRTKRTWIGRLQKGDLGASPEAPNAVASWLAGSAYDAVIWTAIPPNFPEVRASTFSVAAALKYLDELRGEDVVKAYRYIIEAPDQIKTALRGQAYWPEMVAVHEAGHFVIGCALGRSAQRLSRVPVDDRPPQPPMTGCRYADVNQLHTILLACDFGGAWAQMHYLPASVASFKRGIFEQSVILDAPHHHLYGWTGWAPDLTPALQMIALPALVAEHSGLPPEAQIRQLERQVKEFLRIEDVGQAIALTRDALLATPVITGDALASLRSGVNERLAAAAGTTLILAGLN